MAMMTVEEIYERHIKPLSSAQRLRLLAMMAQDLAATTAANAPRPPSLLELEGLGAEIWQGIDAQEYVNDSRSTVAACACPSPPPPLP